MPWLKVETLILQSAEDTPTALSMSQYYADLAPMATLQLIPASDSNLVIEMPEAIANYIREFATNCSLGLAAKSF